MTALTRIREQIVACEQCPRLLVLVLVLGLAPAAHGANRTGRVFTGDGVGGSGDFLMSALHRAGVANIATVVRCAPPGNSPAPAPPRPRPPVTATLSLDDDGDSVINSVADIITMTAGFFGWRASCRCGVRWRLSSSWKRGSH